MGQVEEAIPFSTLLKVLHLFSISFFNKLSGENRNPHIRNNFFISPHSLFIYFIVCIDK